MPELTTELLEAADDYAERGDMTARALVLMLTALNGQLERAQWNLELAHRDVEEARERYARQEAMVAGYVIAKQEAEGPPDTAEQRRWEPDPDDLKPPGVPQALRGRWKYAGTGPRDADLAVRYAGRVSLDSPGMYRLPDGGTLVVTDLEVYDYGPPAHGG